MVPTQFVHFLLNEKFRTGLPGQGGRLQPSVGDNSRTARASRMGAVNFLIGKYWKKCRGN